jgi:hypothetical protein
MEIFPMFRKFAAATAVSAFLLPGIANATLVSGSFSGVITNDGSGANTDNLNYFGLASSAPCVGFPGCGVLSSQTITGTFTYDTSQLSINNAGTYQSGTSIQQGAISVTITINGVSYTFNDGDTAASGVLIESDSPNQQISMNLSNSSDQSVFNIALTDPNITNNSLASTFSDSGIPSSASYTPTPDTFYIADYGNGNGNPPTISVSPTTFYITAISYAPVPEPASTLVFGTAFAALAAYRRRSARKTA